MSFASLEMKHYHRARALDSVLGTLCNPSCKGRCDEVPGRSAHPKLVHMSSMYGGVLLTTRGLLVMLRLGWIEMVILEHKH